MTAPADSCLVKQSCSTSLGMLLWMLIPSRLGSPSEHRHLSVPGSPTISYVTRFVPSGRQLASEPSRFNSVAYSATPATGATTTWRAKGDLSSKRNALCIC
ncbi:hypothetical protein B0J15DRAFT_485238 [Fusarium solani]|uniref:Uncharacterized protein n=1 Tax=Fusarium solani TaxID=169388 RepID=A0A9P9RA67_FUSSL|nr:uncharacterized protein B0J15DRAFT_485238 [Fusarium solani]KAH7271522.1 hypothetical protein B0J15DRAFT_485238 [Fusarium solani]